MEQTIIELFRRTLSGLSIEARGHELGRELADLSTNGGRNYGVYNETDSTPDGGITILSAPAVGPNGSGRICGGKLSPFGTVAAFRLPVA